MPKSTKTTRVPLAQFLKDRGQRRWTYSALALLVALLLMWADRAGLLAEPGGDLDRYNNLTFTVLRVIDGDTLDIDAPDGDHPTTRLRLWGVDTPEMARRDPPKPAEPFAQQATDMTRRLAQGQDVRLTLEDHRTRGDFGRLLAFVELPDGTLLNEALIRAGLSPADDRWSHRYLDRFYEAQREAKEAKVGLWGP